MRSSRTRSLCVCLYLRDYMHRGNPYTYSTSVSEYFSSAAGRKWNGKMKWEGRVRGSLDSQTRRIGTFKFPLWFAARRRNCLKQDYTIIPARGTLQGSPREIRFAFRQSDALWCKNIRRSRGIFSHLVNLDVPEARWNIFTGQSIAHSNWEKKREETRFFSYPTAANNKRIKGGLETRARWSEQP